ncbi:MAG: hypothetical protein QXW58_01350 [Thermosphaera sp.]
MKIELSVAHFPRVSSSRLIRITLLLTFLIPLCVRSLPEILSPVPIGFDTAIYLVQAKQLSSSSSILPFFARILGVFYSIGVDLLILMKVLPVIIFALTVFFSCLYAYTRLGWTLEKVVILCIVMSFSAALLRISWDLHRQSAATLLLMIYMFINPWENLNLKKVIATTVLTVIIGLLHELVLVTLAVINLYLAIASYRNRMLRKSLFFLALSLMPVISYEIGMVFSYSRLATPSQIFENLLEKWGYGGYFNIVSHAVGILIATFWYLLPLAPAGFFHDKYLTPWFTLMLAGYLSQIIIPYAVVKLPERWTLFMTIPLNFYAAKAISSVAPGKRLRIAVITITLVIISLNGFNMLGLTQPINLPSTQYTGFIPSTMVFSTAKPEHVLTVKHFADLVNNLADDYSCVVTHDPWFYYWAVYLTDVRVYAFTGNDPSPSVGRALEDRCNDVYVIWFEGQGSDWEILVRENQLALYRATSTGHVK